VVPTTPATVLELAVALKKEAPGRTAAQIAAILAAQSGWAPSQRTLQRHFADLGFSRSRPDGAVPAAFGRFEAERPNARWVGDALHGPVIAGRKAILIAFLDDHSRLVVAARWGYHENAMALRETLRIGLGSRGRPSVVYVDNGSMFVDSALRRTCAVIGAKLTHSQAGRPQGRGKIERFFRTVRDQFLVEITDAIAGTGTPVSNLAELNSLFDAWVHQVYHQRVHSETDQTPLQRFLVCGPPVPVGGEALDEAFRWGEWRTVTSTAQVSLHGNLYDVDPSLVGARVELVFDPRDLDNIDVRAHSRSYGKAVASRIRRHVHPKAQTETLPPPTPTGIDYLRLIEDRHTRSLGARLHYAHLNDGPAPDNGPGHGPGDQGQPATAMAARPESGTDNAHDDHDDLGYRYDTDLVALAAQTPVAPHRPGTGAPPDPALQAEPAVEAEPAGVAAHLHTQHNGHPDTDNAGDAGAGRPQVAS
jgi:putative transposase